MPIEFWLETGKILAVPVTIVGIVLILRPLLLRSFDRMTSVAMGEVELWPVTEGSAELTGDTPRSIVAESRRRIVEGLAEESGEKLERLRIALESEQANQLIQYHVVSLVQSQVSFWFSIGAATFGFLVIIVSVFFVVAAQDLQTAIICIVSGAIIDAVAALFLSQSTQARRLMTGFFDKLRSDRQFNASLRLCDSVPDNTVQSGLKAQLALFFAGVPADSIFQYHSKTEVRETREGTVVTNE